MAGRPRRRQPGLGDLCRQEFLAEVAEGVARVVAKDESVTVPAGSFPGCTVTRDFSPLEPEVAERKSTRPESA